MLGILLKFSSVSLFGIMSALAKYIGGAIPVGEIVAVRSGIGIVAIGLIVWRTQNLQLLRTANWRSHVLRSSMGTLAMATWFVSLNLAPIADATAMVYAGPLFATLLAAPLLREHITLPRWLAVALGFGGVLIMTGSHLAHADALSAGLLFALLCALFSALSTTFLRQMSRTEHALTTTFYFSLTSTVGAAATGAWGWPMPNTTQWIFLVLIGLLGTSAQFLMSAAFRYAEASVIAPIEYTGIVTATFLGYVAFGEIPAVSIWVGVPLVVVAGLLIVWSEYPPAPIEGHRPRISRTRRPSVP